MPFKSEKQRKWMHANEPEMAKKWEKEETIEGKLRNLIKQEIKSINEGFDKYYLSSLLDSKLKKKLEIAIKNLKGKIDGVGDDWIWFRMPSHNLDLLVQLITKLDRNKNVWIGDKRKNNIWDRRQKINKLEAFRPKGVSYYKQMVFLPKSQLYFDPSNGNFWLMGPGGEPDWDDEPIEPKDRDYKRTLSRLSSKDKSIMKKSLRGSGNWKEATTSVSVPGYLSPKAFSKSTQNAIDVDDEDDEKSESMAAPFRRRKSRGLGRPMKESVNEAKEIKFHQIQPKDYIWYRGGIQYFVTKTGPNVLHMGLVNKGKPGSGGSLFASNTKLTRKNFDSQIRVKFIKKITRDKNTLWQESVKESDLGLTYKKGKTVKVTHKKSGKELIIIDKPNVRKEYEKIGYFAEGQVNELQMAPFSSQEAKQHINQDIKKMSKHLGKASQQSIKIMMDGVKGGKYTAMDISRGIETGPLNRTHEGERPFMKMLWRKVRSGFRRYSKMGKLRK